jgi:hypothetical protein
MRRDGFIVARSLLNPNEISQLRDQLREHFQSSWEPEGLGKHQPNAAVEVPSISWIYSHPAILAVFRELTGQDALVFTGNSDAHMNMLSWWHKDTNERQGGCLPGDYFVRPECNVYRAGIYLQDHTVQHGLTVRKGSHRDRSLKVGEVAALKTQTGDVVFFDMRLTHAGQFADLFEVILLKAARKALLRPLASTIKNLYQRLLRKPEKLSLFFTYGTPAPDTDYYCEFERAQKQARTREEAVHLPSHLTLALEGAGVRCYPDSPSSVIRMVNTSSYAPLCGFREQDRRVGRDAPLLPTLMVGLGRPAPLFVRAMGFELPHQTGR